MVSAATVLALAVFAGPSDSDLLERHRPLLLYDSRERFFAQPVPRPSQASRRRAGDRVYGHVIRDAGHTWLQYWLFYAYNPQDRGVVRTGRHEGDWELIQLRLNRHNSPDLATLAQHTWAEGCRWGELERVRQAPVVYVANGSHASYSRAGRHDRPFPDPNDEADGKGRRVRPRVQPIEDDRPAWVGWPGRWGDSRAGVVPGEQSSPRGPRFQDDDPWQRPAAFHELRAIDCGAGPPGRWWPIAVAALLAVAVAAVVVRRVSAAATARLSGRP